jgi:hypothetical protein
MKERGKTDTEEAKQRRVCHGTKQKRPPQQPSSVHGVERKRRDG